MPLSSIVLFAAVYGVAVASFGPGVVALVARVLARGPRGIPAFVAGFIVGDLVWFAIAATGFALLAQGVAPVFVAIRYVGAAYLAYLGWRAWTAPVEPLEGEPARGESGLRLFLGGLALTLGNPKVVLFFLALLPSVIDLDHITPLGMVEVAVTIVVVLSTTLAAYTLAAVRVRRLFVSVRARRAVNRGAGTLMAGAALAVATR
ncbi:LysE family translocator [Methylobacterium sp. Leaf118]|uniref:LysE family translocator n=1 Tax=Methylobacterium sp. Leaf118 TaxID=2876562 RepID=UPI001E39810C|nr:LysE family translocator [Methylobacterium sp. Leaf118]